MAATKKPTVRARGGTKNAGATNQNETKKPTATSKTDRTATSGSTKKSPETPKKGRAATSAPKRSSEKGTTKSPQAASARRNTPEAPQRAEKDSSASREAHVGVERRVGRTPTGQVVPVTKQKTFRLPEDVVAILQTAVVEAAIRGDRLTESQSVTAAVRAWGKKHGYDKPHEDLP